MVFSDVARLLPTQFNDIHQLPVCNDTLLSDVVITTADVHQALNLLDPNKDIGPDGVNPKVATKILHRCSLPTNQISLN